jgi:SAM-dependent methyltransferase
VINAYDLVRYPNLPFARTHPAAMGAFAALFGKPFAPFAACRVLEIGCGEGVNLLSMALGAPASEFVGVDLAEAPIAVGRAAARAAGIANVRFHVQDIAHMDAGLGRFDYIIAHGVYAWVPAAAREALLRIVGELLGSDGLAIISYNTYPGSRLRQVLRDLLLAACGGVADPSEKLSVARSVLAYQIENWSEEDSFQKALIVAARKMLKRPPEVLFHDELNPFYEPQLLSDVVAAAREIGLDYLCDALPQLSAEAFFPSEKFAAAQSFTAGDWLRFEQLSDFADMRAFRSSIFCRGGGTDRRVEARRLRGLWASGELQAVESKPGAPDGIVFRSGDGAEVSTNDPKLAQFLTAMGAAFPASLALDAAAEDADLAVMTLRLFVAQIIRIATAPFPFTLTPGDRPAVSPLARFQAARGEKLLASLRHSPIQLEDAAARAFITLVDGTRTRDDLARQIVAQTNAAEEVAFSQVSAALASMTKLGLMIS